MQNSYRVNLEAGYILHHYPYRNTSAILEVFSCNYGRVSLVAKGCRSGKSRIASLIRPFQPLLLSWNGKGELHTLTGIETDSGNLVLKASSLMCGYYLNELLLNMLHRHDPHEELFTSYDHAVRGLAKINEEESDNHIREEILRLFEMKVLSEAGFGMILNHDVETNEPISVSKQYCYIPAYGPVESSTDNINGIIISGDTLLALENHELDNPQVLHEAKRLMRALVNQHMEGKPMKSRIMMEKLRSFHQNGTQQK